MIVTGYSTPVTAIGVCDFLSGDARSICRAAEQAAQAGKKKPAPQSEPATTETATAGTATAQKPQKAEPQRKVAAVQNNPDLYDTKQFYGTGIWVDAFEKAVNNPGEFKTFISGMIKTAGGSDATAYALATRPKRTSIRRS